MSNSLILKSPVTFTGASRAPLRRDPMIRPGTKFLFDFTDARCHPSGVITPGPVAAGTTFQSLDNVPVSAVASAAGITVNVDGSIEFPGVAGAGLNVGTVGQFNMYNAVYEMIYGMHLKFPTSGYNTTNYQSLTKNGGNANDSQFYIDTGIGGLTPRGSWGADPAAIGGAGMAAFTPGQPGQHVVRVDPGASGGYQEFRNGALVFTGGNAPGSTVYDKSNSFIIIGGSAAKFTLYRTFLTNIDVSLAQEALWNFIEPDKLSAAQHILKDYQFCANLLTAAPKTPFA